MKRYTINAISVDEHRHGEWVRAEDAVTQCAWCDDTQAIGKLQADLAATRRALARVGEALSGFGCDCECGCIGDHYDECERCIACRIESAMNEREGEEPTDD